MERHSPSRSLNGNPIGDAVELTGLNPGNEIVLYGDVADTTAVKIEIKNLATEYSGRHSGDGWRLAGGSAAIAICPPAATPPSLLVMAGA